MHGADIASFKAEQSVITREKSYRQLERFP